MKKIYAILIAILIFVMPFTSCKKKNNDITTIRLNEVTHSIFYAPMYVAIEKGFFEEYKIKIDLTNGGGADNVMTALLSSNADIGLMGPESVLYVYLQNKSDYPIVFGQLTKKDGSFLVGRNSEPNFKWEDLKDKEVLSGRPGGVPAMTFEYVVNNHNLTNGTNITLNTSVQFNLMTAAFEGGTADYCTMFEPVASDFEARGKGYIVASVGEGAGDVPYTSFIAKQSYINNNKEMIKNFLKALKKANEYINETPKDEVALLIIKQFPSISLDLIQKSLESYIKINAWTDDLQMSKDSFERLETIMKNAGELENLVDMSKIVNNSYAEEVFA